MSHLKNLVAPRSWTRHEKSKRFIVKSVPGPHSLTTSIPLIVLIRNILCLAKTKKEVVSILVNKEIFVDGIVRKEYKFPVGFMDVVEIPKLNKKYRIIYNKLGKLVPIEISDKEKSLKICSIKGKRMVKGNKAMITLHDGNNILIPRKDAKKYKTKSSVILSLPDKKIIKYLAFEKGSTVFVIGGKHIGEVTKIVDIKEFKGPQADVVVLEEKKDVSYDTVQKYAFVVGKGKSEVKLK